jgi:hypothetical protein
MAMTLEEFRRTYDKKSTQAELYRRADLEINGDDRHYEELGDFVEKHPISSLRIIGMRGCSGD